MRCNHESGEDGTARRSTRRTFLGAAAAAGAGVAAVGGVGANPPSRGFPPNGITEWGDPVQLGDGELRTFTTATASGAPTYHGVYLDRAALSGLPSAEALEARGTGEDPGDKYGEEGRAIEIHHVWTLAYFVPIPAIDATPFTFVGLSWNPAGHPPEEVYGVPHFDVHFHMLDAGTVDAIEGLRRAEYDLPGAYVPDGYERIPEPDLDGEPAIVTDMGEHLADLDSPENAPGGFENTLIYGAYDPDGDGVGELSFVEPMVTKAYLEALSGRDKRDVAVPQTYARPGHYPTAYSVRDLPQEDAIAITIENFVASDP